jgi:hypothetical protein
VNVVRRAKEKKPTRSCEGRPWLKKSATIGAAASLSWPSGFWPGAAAQIGTPGSSGVDLGECSFYLSIFLSFYLSIFLSFYLSIFLSFYLSIFLSFYLSIFLSFYLFVMPLGAILQRSELSCFGKVSGAPRQSCEKPSSSVSPIAQHPQEHADRFWRLAYLDRILIAGYADEGVSLLMRAERADVFNLNVAFSPAPVSYHDPVFAHLY